MVPASNLFAIIGLLERGAIVIAVAWLVARLIGWLTRAPRRYTVSSIVIGLVTYLITSFGWIFLILMIPGPLEWSNGEPQNWKTSLWDHTEVTSAAVALTAILCWQAFVRRRHRQLQAPKLRQKYEL